MRAIAEKLRSLEQELAAHRGRFHLFALFLREDSPDVWDLVVAAPWIDTDKFQALRDLAESTRLKLTPDELTKLSKIVIIEESNPALEAVQRATSVEHGLAEVRDSVFFDLPIRHAYIITSRRDQPPSQPVQQPGGSAARS